MKILKLAAFLFFAPIFIIGWVLSCYGTPTGTKLLRHTHTKKTRNKGVALNDC